MRGAADPCDRLPEEPGVVSAHVERASEGNHLLDPGLAPEGLRHLPERLRDASPERISEHQATVRKRLIEDEGLRAKTKKSVKSTAQEDKAVNAPAGK